MLSQRHLVLFVCLLGLKSLQAQPFIDVFGISCQHSPAADFYGKDKHPFAGSTFYASINAPVKVNSKDVLIFSPLFEWNHLGFRRPSVKLLDLYGTTLGISFIKTWNNPKWKTILVSLNRISSDLRNVTLKHYQPGGVIMTTYAKNERVTFKLGAFYNAEFFGAFVLPLIGVDWKVNPRLMVYGILPRGLVMEYKITPRFYAGLNWKSVFNTYRYKSPEPTDYIKITESQLRLFGDFYLTKHMVINIEAGHTLFREIKNRSQLQRQSGYDSNLKVPDGLLFKAAFHYRFRLEDVKGKMESR